VTLKRCEKQKVMLFGLAIIELRKSYKQCCACVEYGKCFLNVRSSAKDIKVCISICSEGRSDAKSDKPMMFRKPGTGKKLSE